LDIGYNKSKSEKDVNHNLNTICNSITSNIFPFSQNDINSNEEFQFFDINNLIDEYNETYTFLKLINFHHKYFFDFINDGWDDFNSLILIEQAHLDLMNIEESDKKMILNQVNIIKKDIEKNITWKGKTNLKGIELTRQKEQKEQKEQRLQFQKALNEFRSAKQSEHKSINLVIIIFK